MYIIVHQCVCFPGSLTDGVAAVLSALQLTALRDGSAAGGVAADLTSAQTLTPLCTALLHPVVARLEEETHTHALTRARRVTHINTHTHTHTLTQARRVTHINTHTHIPKHTH